MGGVITEQSTKFSRDCMNLPSAVQSNPPSIQFILGANLILPMHPHKAYTPWNPFSFHQYNFQPNLIALSLTLNHHSHQLNCEPTEKCAMPRQPKNSTKMFNKSVTIALNNAVNISGENLANQTHNPSMKFNQPLLMISLTGNRPKPHCTNLVPQPSNLQPHCLVQDRLLLWCPLSSRSNMIGNVEVSESDLERILDVINVSWARGTKEVYGTGLLVYYVFCDFNISEDNRGPASPILVIAFISSCTGSYAGGTLVSYIFAV